MVAARMLVGRLPQKCKDILAQEKCSVYRGAAGFRGPSWMEAAGAAGDNLEKKPGEGPKN